MVTGVDLIAEQIRAAQGEVLRYKQEDIQLKVTTRLLAVAVIEWVQLSMSCTRMGGHAICMCDRTADISQCTVAVTASMLHCTQV